MCSLVLRFHEWYGVANHLGIKLTAMWVESTARHGSSLIRNALGVAGEAVRDH